MNAFRLKEWWRYRRVAKGRHGVHSPFVYRFVEEGLQAEIPKTFRQAIRSAGVSSHERAAARTLYLCLKFLQPHGVYCEWTPDRKTLIAFIAKSAGVSLTEENGIESADCLLPGSHDAETTERIFSGNAARMKNGLIFIIADIHASPHNALQWLRLREDARVNLSIDLWHIGLLFFLPEIKERQHFVLKYPA